MLPTAVLQGTAAAQQAQADLAFLQTNKQIQTVHCLKPLCWGQAKKSSAAPVQQTDDIHVCRLYLVYGSQDPHGNSSLLQSTLNAVGMLLISSFA